MKRILLLGVVFLILITGNGMAAITNPDPGTYADDNGAEVFMPNQLVFSIEAIDALGGFPGASTFGFYFKGTDVTNPANLITIFAPDDQDPNPGGETSVPQQALIDFSSGIVFDFDNPDFAVDPLLAIRSTFSGSGSIGFFLKVDPSVADITLFSEASLNSGGLDAFSTFQSLSDASNYLLGVEEPASGTFIGFDVMMGVAPVTDLCLDDPDKTEPGICGCNVPDTDTDGDETVDCNDICPNDPDNDIDGDGVCGDVDNCVLVSNQDQADRDEDGIGDACEDVRILGRAHNVPAQTSKASISMDISRSSSLSGWLKYQYTRKKINFVSTEILGLSIYGNVAIVTGKGTVTGGGEHGFMATIVTGEQPSFGFAIQEINGNRGFSSGPAPAVGGQLQMLMK